MSTDKTTREKINDIHDFVIRMEAVCDDVQSLKKWRDGNGVPGAKTQLYILWGFFCGLSAITVKLAAK